MSDDIAAGLIHEDFHDPLKATAVRMGHNVRHLRTRRGLSLDI